MLALKADPNHKAEPKVDDAAKKSVKDEAPQVYTIDDFERWFVRSEELNSILRRLPLKVVSAAGMANRRDQLLETWEDLETPELDESEVDDDMMGDLLSWVKDSETLIHYIVYTRNTNGVPEVGGKESAKASNDGVPEASSLPPQTVEPSSRPGPQVIASMSGAPGVTGQWHWPWIEGWDDLEKREGIINPKKAKPKKMSLKRAATMTALGAGAVYVMARYMDE